MTDTDTKEKPKAVPVVYNPGPGDPIAVTAYGKRFVAGHPVEIEDPDMIERARGNHSFDVDGEDKAKAREDARTKAAEAAEAERKAVLERDEEEMEARHARERAQLESRQKREADRIEARKAGEAKVAERKQPAPAPGREQPQPRPASLNPGAQQSGTRPIPPVDFVSQGDQS